MNLQYPERKTVWVKKGEDAMFEAQPHLVKVNVYGGIGLREKICLVIMAGNMNSEGHIYDLENALIPNADRIYGGKRWLLKHDNAPISYFKFKFRFYLWPMILHSCNFQIFLPI